MKSDENTNCLSSELVSHEQSDEKGKYNERELALEVCIISLLLKDLEFDVEKENCYRRIKW